MNDRINYLYKRYCENRCTSAEWDELMALLEQPENEEQLTTLVDNTWDQIKERPEPLPNRSLQHILQSIINQPTYKKRSKGQWYAALAAALCCVFVGVYYLQVKQAVFHGNTQALVPVADIPPGENKAVLILEDGREIDLQTMEEKEVTQINSVYVKRKENGWVVFEQDRHVGPNQLIGAKQNSIRTPRGGEYRVTLPDGSVVLLNASSLISFPSYFSGNERRVELIGEAYFEINNKDDRGKLQAPFVVHTSSQDIQVLGTSFNVQAYPDQKLHYTTLLTGAVKISTESRKQRILKPGEQAVVREDGRLVYVKSVDLEEITAWKDGYFLFNNETLERIMEQVARWYDVEVEYVGEAKKSRFFGIYSRAKSLKSLLLNLEQTGKIRFEMLSNDTEKKGRRVIIKVYYI